jgi:hypothetical protein
MAHTLTAMKDKIAKLLAKAESTDNPAEAETFTAAAERLMLKLGIDAAELEHAGQVKPEQIVEVRRQYTGGYAVVMVPFVHGIALAYGNINVLQAKRGTSRSVYLIGFESDVAMLCTLLDSVEQQSITAMRGWKRANPGPADNARLVAARSFIRGFGSEVADRLRALRVEVSSEASPGAALVLVGKQERVDEWLKEAYPTLKAGRAASRNIDYAALFAGRVEGSKANLNNSKSVTR